MQKIYLGDGAYAEFIQSDQLRIWTSNGIKDTNEVFLGPQEFSILLGFVSSYWMIPGAPK